MQLYTCKQLLAKHPHLGEVVARVFMRRPSFSQAPEGWTYNLPHKALSGYFVLTCLLSAGVCVCVMVVRVSASVRACGSLNQDSEALSLRRSSPKSPWVPMGCKLELDSLSLGKYVNRSPVSTKLLPWPLRPGFIKNS